MLCGHFPFYVDNDPKATMDQILRAPLKFTVKLSEQCCDLISCMLKRNRQERATMNFIETHPWLLSSWRETFSSVWILYRDWVNHLCRHFPFICFQNNATLITHTFCSTVRCVYKSLRRFLSEHFLCSKRWYSFLKMQIRAVHNILHFYLLSPTEFWTLTPTTFWKNVNKNSF
jgi:serine/threonine protein kinase